MTSQPMAIKSGNQNTQRAYRKEAERMLLWAVIEREKALSDLTVDDCARYRDWLSLLGRTDSGDWNFRLAAPALTLPLALARFRKTLVSKYNWWSAYPAWSALRPKRWWPRRTASAPTRTRSVATLKSPSRWRIEPPVGTNQCQPGSKYLIWV